MEGRAPAWVRPSPRLPERMCKLLSNDQDGYSRIGEEKTHLPGLPKAGGILVRLPGTLFMNAGFYSEIVPRSKRRVALTQPTGVSMLPIYAD
jgi:hypothetical protein